MTLAVRVYRCRNCGNENKISTNHLGACIDYCRECSWKPSWGPDAAVPFNGRTYRNFYYVKDLE
jgi:hypothetical protein